MKHSFRAKLILLLCLCLIMLTSGCAFRQLSKEVAEIEQTYSMAGKITLPSAPKGSVVVILYARREGKVEIDKYSIASETENFSFFVSKGTYYLAAFEDLNNNLSYDAGEAAGCLGAPDEIVLPKASGDSRDLLNLDFRLQETDRFIAGFPSVIDPQEISESVFAQFGRITTLDDKIFSTANGTIGYWQPLTFLRDFGIGVYFLEPYDPAKIPVLFIHGASGNPADWKKTIDRMDRTKFQPWLYYYPSGLRLDSIAGALNEIIKRVYQAYRFKTLYVTAQSMGGLVARSFILKNFYDDHQDYIKLFVSISTPWNGHRLTAKGVQGAPTAIPSWHDMVPESEFIRSIFKRPFFPGLKYYLLFSYRGDCSLLMQNNDGTVELSSELDYRAQAEANKIYGFDEDHGSIVFSPKYLEYYQRILSGN